MTTMALPLPARPRRRGAELVLLILAVLIGVAGQSAVALAHGDPLSGAPVRFGGTLAVVAILGHLALRWLAPSADPVLLPCVVLLNGVGLAVIHRVDLAIGDTKQANGAKIPAGVAPVQLVWLALGFLLFLGLLVFVRDYRLLERYRYTLALVGIVLLLAPSVLPAKYSTVNGARIWIRVAGFSLQPSEVAKLLLVIFFASYLVAKREVLALATRRVLGLPVPRARDLGPVLVAWAASVAVLVRERDLGSSLLFFGIFVVMLYVATQRVSWVVIGLLLFVGGAAVSYHLFGHVRDRVAIWLHPLSQQLYDKAPGGSYQLAQGLFGFGQGGVLGTGLGRGRPDLVPYARTDFIFSSIGEELGLVGVMAVLLVYGLLVARGLRAALGTRDAFGKLLAAGLAFSIALQVFVVVGGVMRLIPLTGLTLPFLSYGGSSMVSNWVIVALLLRVSDAGRGAPRVPLRSPASFVQAGDGAPPAPALSPAATSQDADGERTEAVPVPVVVRAAGAGEGSGLDGTGLDDTGLDDTGLDDSDRTAPTGRQLLADRGLAEPEAADASADTVQVRRR